jgi:hypothetical protein
MAFRASATGTRCWSRVLCSSLQPLKRTTDRGDASETRMKLERKAWKEARRRARRAAGQEGREGYWSM